jgi:NAD(P)-dependent dehydrogenase (short-subunit alcohol dehydrogenase family)
MAKALALNGAAKVYIAGRRLEVLEAAAASIGLPSVIPVKCDVTSKASLEEAVAAVEKDSGFINLLICNSGIGGPQVKQPEPETTIEEWQKQQWNHPFEDYLNTFSVNTVAVWYTAIAFLKLLDNGNKKGNVQQTSHIITTGSIGGFNKMAPGGWAYGQSKAAVAHLTKHLAKAHLQWDIRYVFLDHI